MGWDLEDIARQNLDKLTGYSGLTKSVPRHHDAGHSHSKNLQVMKTVNVTIDLFVVPFHFCNGVTFTSKSGSL